MNYKHLLYFMQVAKAGSVMRASQQLHLTPQTISGQIQLLESDLGVELFAKSGRGLALTDAGRSVLGYATDIFALGAELQATLRDKPAQGRTREFRVGVADAIPKSVAVRLIEPATHLPDAVRLVCHGWKLDSLLAELALNHLDLVLSDGPIPSDVKVRAFSHRLGVSGVSFFANTALRKTFKGRFPAHLDGAPLLMPADDSALAPRLRAWFQANALSPRTVAEFDDSAMAKAFASRGLGVVVGPTILAAEIESTHGLKALGRTDEVQVEYFAISVERRITHPCVAAITQAARRDLFGPLAARRIR
jgi:LysR family transcriptional regulator, transcriptional activator of nhaA